MLDWLSGLVSKWLSFMTWLPRYANSQKGAKKWERPTYLEVREENGIEDDDGMGGTGREKEGMIVTEENSGWKEG